MSKGIELDPKLASAWDSRGIVHSSLGQWEKAAADHAKDVTLAPRDGHGYNNFAWLLATCPDPKFRDPARAVQLAKKATGLMPKANTFWNTLGVANYRAGDWQAARTALEKSMELQQGGNSFDWIFLAMAHWRLGEKDKAREWYDRAVQWMDKNQPTNEELRRFRAEAAELLGLKEKK